MPDAAMRLVSADTVRERVTKLILTVSRDLPPDVLEALAAARANERSPRGGRYCASFWTTPPTPPPRDCLSARIRAALSSS